MSVETERDLRIALWLLEQVKDELLHREKRDTASSPELYILDEMRKFKPGWFAKAA